MSTLPFPRKIAQINKFQMSVGNRMMDSLVEQIDRHFNIPKIKFERCAGLSISLQDLNLDKCYCGTIIFESPDGYTYKLSALLEFDPVKPTLKVTASEVASFNAKENELTNDIETHSSKYAVWLERANYNTEDFLGATKIVVFDSWPKDSTVYRYPHHYHTYSKRNKIEYPGRSFDGHLDQVVFLMLPYIESKKAS